MITKPRPFTDIARSVAIGKPTSQSSTNLTYKSSYGMLYNIYFYRAMVVVGLRCMG